MDDKKINSHLILLLTVSIAGVVVAAAGRWITLGKGADAGTANLIFLIICGIAVVVYLILVTTLFHLFAPFFAKLQAKRKPTVIVLENTSEPEPELKPFEELPTLTPIEEIKRTAEERQAERTAGQIRIFHEYTHYAAGPYVATESLSRLCNYIELYAHGEELPKGIIPIRTNKLSNYDLFHFGWNMSEHFNVGKKYEVVPWLQFVFANLRDLEPSYIKGKLSTPRRKHDLIPITDNIPEELARLKG
ncbi:MAG: magnesium transporter [Alistipes sp.]|jgi:hypothetical protein|uniref:magnesium transporter n=1 Tax=Bacteroidales TaxID=171549 RepID=UPI001DB9ABBE|nr:MULTISPECIES: magnesium transporter [Bacteroidales]MBS5020562.1 magnesium transporter [Alistipes sp.]